MRTPSYYGVASTAATTSTSTILTMIPTAFPRDSSLPIWVGFCSNSIPRHLLITWPICKETHWCGGRTVTSTIAALVTFGLPVGIGFLWGGWVSALGAFLIAGVARVVVLQHCTFCINSLCHYLGTRPYSSRCSARDSGEGYHNYHHEFPHDYRNGVKPWQWDPTKWLIWTLSKVGLT